MTDYTLVTLNAAKAVIDSSLEFVADHYDIFTPSSTALLNSARGDTVTASIGLKDAGGAAKTIGRIANGIVDEYEISFSPDSVEMTLRGRDQAYKLLDRYYNPVAQTIGLRYVHAPGPTPVSTTTRVDSLGDIIPITTTRVGWHTARSIAQDLVGFVGLQLSWEVRDYIMYADFDAIGRVSELLKRLVEPWTQVEPYRADIFIQGSVVIVRYRQQPGAPMTPNIALTMADARQSHLTIRKRPMRKIGRVTLTGAKNSAFLSQGPTIASQGQDQKLTTTSTQYDDAGNFQSSTITTTTYRMPDRIATKIVKEEYTADNARPPSPQIKSRTTTVSKWEDSNYGSTGRTNNPKHLSDKTVAEGNDDNNVWQTNSVEITEFTYDSQNFETGKTKRTQTRDTSTNQLNDSGLEVTTLMDIDQQVVKQTVDTYVPDGKTPPNWTLTTVGTTESAGYRPGGPGRSAGVFGAGTSGAMQNFELTFVVNTDLDAQPLTYSNPNLVMLDLEFLQTWFVAANLLWEYEFNFTGVTMPWVVRSTVIQFTNLVVEDGVTTLPLPPALVTQVTLTYDESKPEAESVAHVRAFGWSLT